MKVSASGYNFISRMKAKNWRILNSLPEYVDASYDGFTGVKLNRFPTYPRSKGFIPDISHDFHVFEEHVLQELKNTMRTPFGKIKALWKICRNMGTGESWDTKFLPEFPGRTEKGQKQYAKYLGKIVSGNDMSNTLYGHVCAFMGIPASMTKLLARLDAKGFLEPFAKGKLPSKKLLAFQDTFSDQKIIEQSVKNFDLKKYRLK